MYELNYVLLILVSYKDKKLSDSRGGEKDEMLKVSVPKLSEIIFSGW